MQRFLSGMKCLSTDVNEVLLDGQNIVLHVPEIGAGFLFRVRLE